MSEDTELQQTVLAELNWAHDLIAGHIGVAADDGIVTLSGHVESYAAKRRAEDIATSVRGVKGLAENISVRLPEGGARDDEKIAAAVLERLWWNVTIPRDAIKVKVTEGWVTVTGEVKHWLQKETIREEITPLIGVTGLSNNVTIAPHIDTSTLQSDIKGALERKWFLTPNAVHVSAKGGKVVLTGTVSAYFERNIAAQCAWAARGTTDVTNDILVV
jgi:osmotically-inducible protein OsmY